jgi:hypothetical protein
VAELSFTTYVPSYRDGAPGWGSLVFSPYWGTIHLTLRFPSSVCSIEQTTPVSQGVDGFEAYLLELFDRAGPQIRGALLESFAASFFDLMDALHGHPMERALALLVLSGSSQKGTTSSVS